MIRTLFAASLAALALGAPAMGQAAPGEGPLDISADSGEVFDTEGRLVYTGDVNVVRGGTRLRADRVEAFFDRTQGGGFRDLQRIVAEGEVFYVTASEIARGNRGVYDLVTGQITLTGDVVLTQGCNVSTGQRLVADLEGGSARLTGAEGEGQDQRVRSVFFDTPDDQPAEARDCPQPTIPGEGPRAFDDQSG